MKRCEDISASQLVQEMKKKRQSKRAGLKPLGPVSCPESDIGISPESARNRQFCHPFCTLIFEENVGTPPDEVMAREEAVDPLQKVVAWSG